MDATTLPVRARLEPALGIDDAIPGRLAANPGDVARFNDLMTPPANDAAQPAAAVAPVDAAAAGTRTLGDYIMDGLQGVSGEVQDNWKAMKDALSASEPMSMQQMLQLQMGLSEASMTYELVSKCVSRSTQNLDQLVKLQ